MNTDVFLAVLAMDSYNREDGARIKVEGNQVGNARVILREALGLNDADYQDWLASGFYAVAYDMSGVAGYGTGQTVISYRGTDVYNPLVKGSDIWNGWVAGAGWTPASQIGLAKEFHKAVAGVGSLRDIPRNGEHR